jgi:Conserved in the green lineage and diatoms 27
MKESVTQFCPVPQEQQPSYEYQQLQDSWFFRWATLEFTDYFKKLLWVSFATSIIAAPIAAASFLPTRYPLKFFLSSIGGITFLTALVVFQLYFGWLYVSDRLYRESISYEESGWYDGQVWLKPESMLERDRLIVSYEIRPIVNRLKKTFMFLFGIVIVGSIIWFV